MDEKFQFKKKFGQNFLKNEKVLTRIVDVADIKDESLTIEVGPGSGELSESIKQYGVLQPLLVQKKDKYYVMK